MTCRICLDDGDLISPCRCTGTAAFVHEKCLVRWLNTSKRTDCEICKFEYVFEEVIERKCVVCPVWPCNRTTSTVFFFLFLMVPLFSFASGVGPEYIFFGCNLFFWGLILYERHYVYLLEESAIWKSSLALGQFFVALQFEYWFFFEVEVIFSGVLFLVVYLYLCCNQSKQVVQYIYTNENI